MSVEVDLYCPHCDYNLRGVESDVCPECGEAVDRARLARVRLPWAQRRRIGWFKAYWKTVWYAVFRPFALVGEMEAGPRIGDAKRFWFWTAVHGWTPFVILVVVLGFNRPDVKPIGWFPQMITPTVLVTAGAAVWPIAIVALGILLWLLAVTGMPSYFCHPRGLDVERQDRAIALSYYAGAVLAMLAPASLLMTAVIWIGMQFELDLLLIIAAWVGGIFLVALILTWYMRTLRIVKMAADRSRGFTTILGFLLPATWVILFFLLGLLLPWMVIYFVLFLLSRFL